jgi:hypothetical protein
VVFCKGCEQVVRLGGKELCVFDWESPGSTYGARRDVREIGSDTGGVDDIVQGELVNVRRGLEEEREGL